MAACGGQKSISKGYQTRQKRKEQRRDQSCDLVSFFVFKRIVSVRIRTYKKFPKEHIVLPYGNDCVVRKDNVTRKRRITPI